MKENFMKIPLYIHDFQTLKLLLEEIIQDEIELFEGFSKYTLHISSKESKITISLRSELFPKPYLAIAAISITPSNQGKGSIILEWFKTFTKEKGFERLVLQEVITKEGYHFSLKNRFTKACNLYEETFGDPSSINEDYELYLT